MKYRHPFLYFWIYYSVFLITINQLVRLWFKIPLDIYDFIIPLTTALLPAIARYRSELNKWQGLMIPLPTSELVAFYKEVLYELEGKPNHVSWYELKKVAGIPLTYSSVDPVAVTKLMVTLEAQRYRSGNKWLPENAKDFIRQHPQIYHVVKHLVK